MDSEKLRKGLKILLKKHHLEYSDLAQIWKISESSVKRIMASGEISLERLSLLSERLGIRLSHLFSIIEKSPQFDVLTEAQDQIIGENPILMYMNIRFRGGDSLEDFAEETGIPLQEVYKLALKLEKVDLIRLDKKNIVFVNKGPYRIRDRGLIEKKLFSRFVEAIYKHNSHPDRIRTPFGKKTEQLTRAFELFMTEETRDSMMQEMSQIYHKYAEKSQGEVATLDFKKLRCVSSLIMSAEQLAWKEALMPEIRKYRELLSHKM